MANLFRCGSGAVKPFSLMYRTIYDGSTYSLSSYFHTNCKKVRLYHDDISAGSSAYDLPTIIVFGLASEEDTVGTELYMGKPIAEQAVEIDIHNYEYVRTVIQDRSKSSLYLSWE